MTDKELVERFWARDQGAIGEVEQLYGAYCAKIAQSILGSSEDAEECVSDVWLKVWSAVPPARPANLRAFLAKLTRNLAINRLRAMQAQRRGGGEAALVLEELAECLPGGGSPEADFDARELSEAVNRFVRSLTAREGDYFVRRCFYTEPVRDIAARYGVSAHAVTVSLARTRRKLRTYLCKEGFLDE